MMKSSNTDQIKAKRSRGFLMRLRRNTAGNVMMMAAFSVIPLMGMIGAGVDMSRAYLVKSRLQQACDAGALAGRKFMTGSTLTTAVATQAQNFFSNNFPTGTFGTTDVSFTPTLDAAGQVTATATAKVPMTVMQIFGNTSISMNAVCDAKLEISNTDVMMVLDVTGSMANCPDDSNCGGGPGSKIVGLRQAVLDFYDTLHNASSSTAQLRFGFVPYDQSVNIGDVLPTPYLADNWTYQSRLANMTTPVYVPQTGSNVLTTEIYNGGTTITQGNCTKYGQNKSFSGFVGGTNPVVTPNSPPTTATIDQYSNNSASGVDWGYTGGSGTYRICRRTRNRSAGVLDGYKFTNWTYQEESYDTSSVKSGSAISLAIADPSTQLFTGKVATAGSYNMAELAAASPTGGRMTSTWNKCVEERDTVQDATFPTIPSVALDLDIDTLPSTEASKWRPAWHDVVFNRYDFVTETTTLDYNNPVNNTPSRQMVLDESCPTAVARKMAVVTRAQVQTFTNSLTPGGYTFHDLGMAWGARLISPTGIFASENATAPNGKPISRHIVFMTDGLMRAVPSTYSSHGLEYLDQRVAPQGSVEATMNARHNERFQALCDAAQAKNISIWTVAFGTDNPPTLVSCANPGQAFRATDTATLRAQFQTIAARISSLRLTR
jgi:Flp pilus assembly protein TadG